MDNSFPTFREHFLWIYSEKPALTNQPPDAGEKVHSKVSNPEANRGGKLMSVFD